MALQTGSRSQFMRFSEILTDFLTAVTWRAIFSSSFQSLWASPTLAIFIRAGWNLIAEDFSRAHGKSWNRTRRSTWNFWRLKRKIEREKSRKIRSKRVFGGDFRSISPGFPRFRGGKDEFEGSWVVGEKHVEPPQNHMFSAATSKSCINRSLDFHWRCNAGTRWL